MDPFEAELPSTKGFTLFYGHSEKAGPSRVFSNFYLSAFTDPAFCPGLPRLEQHRDAAGTVHFHSVEQYMHATKAVIFKDYDVLDQMMQDGADPAQAKKLGRQASHLSQHF
jgi:hypothetical protein